MFRLSGFDHCPAPGVGPVRPVVAHQGAGDWLLEQKRMGGSINGCAANVLRIDDNSRACERLKMGLAGTMPLGIEQLNRRRARFISSFCLETGLRGDCVIRALALW